jgi:uncharacterized membrane protein YphA (DoxX/SURF4 family)
MKKVNFLDIITVLFAVLFVYAAVSKLLAYDEFQAQIGQSPLLTNHVWWISWFIPFIEILVALMLFIPRLQLVALYASFSLMFMFTAYISFILTFSPFVPCSCGGILSSMGWTSHLIFNIAFTLLAIIGIFILNRKKKQSQSLISPI